MENYSLSDIVSATGGNGFGGEGLWIFALLLLLFGSNSGGAFGRGDYGQFATAASQQEILFGQQFQSLDNKMDRGFTSLGNGIADATFALNNSIKDGDAAINGNVVNEGRSLQSQLAECCCKNVQMNAEVKAAIHAEGEATRSMIQQNKIESLQAQVNELKTQNMFCGIPKVSPYGYTPVWTNGTTCGCGNI